MDTRTRNSLIVFLTLTFAISWIFYGWSFAGAPLNRVVPLLMWTPGLCALFTQLAFSTMAGLGWRPGPLRYLCGAALLPVVYCLVVYAPVWLTGAGQFDGSVLGRVFPLLPFALAEVLCLRSEKRSAARIPGAHVPSYPRLLMGRHRDGNHLGYLAHSLGCRRRLQCRDAAVVRGRVLYDLGDGHVGEYRLAAPALRESLDSDYLPCRPQCGRSGAFYGEHHRHRRDEMDHD